MPKVHVDLWIYDEKQEERGLYLQKVLEIDFTPAVGMDFEPKLWTNKEMGESVLSRNENRFLKFKIVDILWSEVYPPDLSVSAEGEISSRALDYIWQNLDEIELKTDWGYTGFPLKPNEYFDDLRKEQERAGIKKTKKGGESGNKKK